MKNHQLFTENTIHLFAQRGKLVIMKEMSDIGPDLEEVARRALDKKVSRRVINVSGATAVKATGLAAALSAVGIGSWFFKRSNDQWAARVTTDLKKYDEAEGKIDRSFQLALGDVLNSEKNQELLQTIKEGKFAKRIVNPMESPITGDSPNRIHVDKSLEYNLWFSQETVDQSPDISATLNYRGDDVVSGTLWVHLQDGKVSGPIQTAGWISQQDYQNKRNNPSSVGQEINEIVKFPADNWNGNGMNVVMPPNAPQGMFPVEAFVAQGAVDAKDQSVSYEVHANNDLII